MKYIRSTSNLTYTFEGKVIPAYDKKPLQISDELYQKMQKTKVIASLLKNNGIIVLSEYKDDTVRNSDLDRQLQAQQNQIEALQRDLEKAKASSDKADQFDALKAEAEQALADKDAEIAALKAQLEKKSSKSKKDDE